MSPTDPAGLAFVSYRRARAEEIELLIAALHDHGIPTWRDVDDLDTEPTESELVAAIADPRTAAALVWVTPDVADSPTIKRVEAPRIHERWKQGDGFFVIPVAAGGLGYDEATALISEFLGLDDFGSWNIELVTLDPVGAEGAAEIAQSVLRRRLRTVAETLDPGEPLRIGLFTRARPPAGPGLHLALDWQPRFDGRLASEDSWTACLMPALGAMAEQLVRLAPDRAVLASGLASLPALVAFGASLLQPRGIRVVWEQAMSRTGETQEWSLDAPPDSVALRRDLIPLDVASDELAVCVGLTTDVEPAIKRAQADGVVPRLRAMVAVGPSAGSPLEIESPGQARTVVDEVKAAIKDALLEYPVSGKVHLFLAAPAGVAVMLGQSLNALGPVQLYEHLQTDPVGTYARAVALHPGS